jgi:hypothetical protein
MSTTVMGQGSAVATGGYPIQVSYEPQASYSKLYAVPIVGYVIRSVMLIPHFIALMVVGLVNMAIHLAAWVPVLTSGQYPQWAFNWSTGLIRWTTRVSAYFFGLTDAYPPFSLTGDDSYPVKVTFEYPANPGKLYAIPVVGLLIREVLLIPHLIALWVLGMVVNVLQLVLWIPVITSGQYPEIGWSVVGGLLRWYARIAGYFYGLTDQYPPFQLSE